MFRWQQLAAPAGRAAARRGLDELLAHARRHRPPAVVSDLLGMGIAVRIHGGCNADAGDTAMLLTEFRKYAERSGNDRLLGNAWALRARYNTTFRRSGSAREQDPLVDAAKALDVLTEITGPGPDEDEASWSRSHLLSLDLLIVALLTLGAHEIADEVSHQAIVLSDAGGSALDRLAHQLYRVRLQLSWALRLERSGREAAATSRLVGAAQAAHDAARLWAPAFGRNWADGPPAARQCPIIGVAYAFHRPGPEHLDTLAELLAMAHYTDDRVAVAIATARCLLADHRPDDALAALAPVRSELAHGRSDAVLVLALHREFSQAEAAAATAAGAGRPARDTDALSRYAAALEGELRTLQEAAISALRSHRENHRLSREHGVLTLKHGAVTAQLMEDPLTGLPNRRALDLQLAAATSEASQPCSVALIDLDRFKDVNDGHSHAEGDVVLRRIATTLRATLRSHDVVARYGGDEFVVIMPSTPLAEAKAALTRATQVIAELPPEVASGVTMSVGVVGAEPHGEPAATLAAADAAMYQAKHEGGNKVISAPAGAARTGPAVAEVVEIPAQPRAVGPDQQHSERAAADEAHASRVMFTVTSSAAAAPPE